VKTTTVTTVVEVEGRDISEHMKRLQDRLKGAEDLLYILQTAMQIGEPVTKRMFMMVNNLQGGVSGIAIDLYNLRNHGMTRWERMAEEDNEE
jgi:hypothetical protein